ncbi:MAG TPA: NAD(P)H-binding protein [Solirubrobacterales bacterium]|nr:NAD(P)H-binding protein [Solirubrobacterales bacterium]
MKIAVVGGTGMVGGKVVAKLAADGHDVRILTRNPPAELPSGASHHPIDLKTREGLDSALAGIETVIDVANEQKAARQVLVDGTADLLRRCEAASIDHYVGISILGCEKFGFKYYAAKTAQEEVIRSAPIGWSLLKASQFHELLEMVFGSVARFRLSPTGSIPLQTIAASVVAERLAAIAVSGPTRETETIAGPRIETLAAMSRTWRRAEGRSALPLPIWLPGKAGRELRSGGLTDPDATVPGPTFGEWLADRH